jgi:choline dehydrogenase-like flavoprotein
MPYDCDLIVVGSGAGGATLAYACARAGKSVLVLERGRKFTPEKLAHDEKATLIDKQPYDDRDVEVNGAGKRLYTGGCLGGGTSLYGAAFLRPSADDFHPGKHYGDRIPHAIWDWPISYNELAPYYAEAEIIYGVAGHRDEDFGPLEKPGQAYPKQPLPLHPINQKLIAANRAFGLRPFQLPLAIDPTLCLRCASCAGYLCPTGARASSAQLLDRAILEGLPLRVRTYVEVEQLLRERDGNVGGMRIIDRASGERNVCSARRYALAAGAIGSPLLLQRSGMGGPLVGRHYMMHLSPLAIGIFPRHNGAAETFVKQVGFADFYFGTDAYRHKMGLVQSLPVPGPLLTAKMAPLLPRAAVRFLRQRMLPLAGIIEDLPDPANRVSLGRDGRPRLRHRFGAYDQERGLQLGRFMSRIVKRAGAALTISKRFASDEHAAHQCGTLRFGNTPAHAVLGPDCRMFKYPNVFVIDGSFFPTSLGVGPALTIIANALRVATLINREI